MAKAIGAAGLALLAQRRELDIDERVSRYWSEFAAAGKRDITVRTLISHQAGLHGLAGDFILEELIEHNGLAARLAASAPLWEPGTRVGDHSLMMGTVFRELVQRISGLGTGEFFEQSFREPFDLDLWIGCPSDQDHRIAPPTFVDLTVGMPPEIGQLMHNDPVRGGTADLLLDLRCNPGALGDGRRSACSQRLWKCSRNRPVLRHAGNRCRRRRPSLGAGDLCAGLVDRSSRPHSIPRQTCADVEDTVIAARLVHRRGPQWLSWETGVPARTITARHPALRGW